MDQSQSSKPRIREYEIIYILRASVNNEQAKTVGQKVENVIGKFSGKIIKVDNWGRRKLAYPIEKQTRGLFVYVRFICTADAIAEIGRNLRLIDYVVRFQTVKLSDEVKLDALEINDEETQFLDVEDGQDFTEKTLEQKLGMAPRAPRYNNQHARDNEDSESPEEDSADSESVENTKDKGEAAGKETKTETASDKSNESSKEVVEQKEEK